MSSGWGRRSNTPAWGRNKENRPSHWMGRRQDSVNTPTTTSYRLNEQPLPDTVKCGRCKRVIECNQQNFSQKQLQHIREKVADNRGHGPIDSKDIACNKCIERNFSEMKCEACEEVKSLGEFSHSQRKKKDSAKCLKCMDQIRKMGDIDTHVIPEYNEGEHKDSESSDDEDKTSGGVALPSTAVGSMAGWTEQRGEGVAGAVRRGRSDIATSMSNLSFNPRGYSKYSIPGSTEDGSNSVCGPSDVSTFAHGPMHQQVPGSASNMTPPKHSKWAKPVNGITKDKKMMNPWEEGSDSEGETVAKASKGTEQVDFDSSDDDF